MRTLVIHSGGIGDFLLTCPAILQVAKEGPVELAGDPSRLALATAHVKAIHPINRIDFESVFSNPSRTLCAFLARFDRAIVWMRDDGTIASTLRGCGVSDARVFPGLPPHDWTQHASRYYLHCLGLPDAAPLHLHFDASPTPHDVIIHPGSGSSKKNWPADRFVALANALESLARSVTWCFGPAEREPFATAASRIIRCDSLISVARELAATNLYIGNDSGITHLAAAAGAATIALFGPTVPQIWAPLGKNVTVIQGSPWPEVEHVRTAAIAKWHSTAASVKHP